jgi:hypothetical protein
LICFSVRAFNAVCFRIIFRDFCNFLMLLLEILEIFISFSY